MEQSQPRQNLSYYCNYSLNNSHTFFRCWPLLRAFISQHSIQRENIWVSENLFLYVRKTLNRKRHWLYIALKNLVIFPKLESIVYSAPMQLMKGEALRHAFKCFCPCPSLWSAAKLGARSWLQGCWRNVDRWIEAWIEGEASASTSLFFVIHVRTSKWRPFKFRINSGLISRSSFPKANSKCSIVFEEYSIQNPPLIKGYTLIFL